ncbi:uncharacterized protein LOC126881397 isoform X3 [Diabrotica virgifera virgifera]|uniref:Tc1-like transposase DDE domain-containing protein n=1 Tax=Diabrotica virgifera virgifera TaxID=50390 RepID=A0ABM5JUK1_DIAVI|nr:uncharacterized protein LOC126881397 isoform X3 [Diabrotica virgifera virgifera]XP_050501613.1 uncharacterized protein LOC126881397 isoform X3 [Diabrotica virgifera virgifera]
MWRPWDNVNIAYDNADIVEIASASVNVITKKKEIVKKIRMHLNAETQQVCLNVYKNLRTKFGFDETLLAQATSDLTEIPLSTVYKIVKNEPYHRKKRCDYKFSRPLNPSLIKLLKTTIYDCYKSNEIPTIEIIRKKLETTGRNMNCCEKTLQNWIKKMGFKFKKINKRQAIMESQRTVNRRNMYLEEITKYRQENRRIYYLDETWYDTHDTVKKGWTDGSSMCIPEMPANKGLRLIIVHCGGSEGWVPNALKLCGKKMEDCNVDYHKNMEADIFEDWFENSLIPNLEKNSVIVLDNASYHSRQLTKIPNTSSKKADLQNFLMENDLYFEDFYTKKQLIEVLHTKQFRKLYALESIAEKHGHTILRLPPYFCVFNPIELIWGQLKPSIRRSNKFPKFDKKVIEIIKKEVANITKVDWQKRIAKVIQSGRIL